MITVDGSPRAHRSATARGLQGHDLPGLGREQISRPTPAMLHPNLDLHGMLANEWAGGARTSIGRASPSMLATRNPRPDGNSKDSVRQFLVTMRTGGPFYGDAEPTKPPH